MRRIRDQSAKSYERTERFTGQEPMERLDGEFEVPFSQSSDLGQEELEYELDEESFGYSRGPRRLDKDSTITIAEKQAFDEIFANIRARTMRKDSGDRSGISSIRTKRDLGVDKSPAETLNDIMNAALQDEAGRKPSSRTSRPTGLALDRKSGSDIDGRIQTAVKQYPKFLQNEAQEALHAQARLADLEMESSSTEEIEKLQQPERERIERLLRDATTDIELWQVMEAEVFSLISKLGLEDKPSETVSKPRKTSKRSKKAVIENAQELKAAYKPIAPTNTPRDLAILGPLYPLFLLLGLRLLSTSFHKPSPLVLSILPRIKSLGLLSHALGASTPLYNHLLRTTYDRYDNLPGVLSLLQEMDQAGIDLDMNTKETLDEIIRSQKSMKTGDGGEAMMALGLMPGWTDNIGKFGWWRRRAQMMIKEKQDEDAGKLQWSA